MARGIDDDALDHENDKFVHVVSCNTHNISVLVKTLAIYALAAVVAFVVAIVIKGIVRLLQAIEGSSASATPPETMRPELADLPPAIPPEHIAAIGAAVHAMMGTYRIIHIED